MKNFELYNPVKLIFGENQYHTLSNEIPKGSKVLMIYGGGSIKNNGVYENVMNGLKDFEVHEFSGVEPNPRFHTLMKALDIINEKKIDFLLAVGGGSVIDGTKFIASAATYKGEDKWEILKNRIRTEKALPFGAVLTLPATGSEMNSGAVVTNEQTGEKLGMGGPGLFPKFSITDPNVISSLPKRQLQNGVVDAFTHVMEQYLTYNHGAILQDRIAESILQSLIEIGPKVIDNPMDYELASNFMWCCTMALNGLIQKGVPTDWATHMIGHELTAEYEIDHARTLAIIAPNLYKVMFENKKEKLAQYGVRVWEIDKSLDATEIAKIAIEKTESFLKSVGMDLKISEYTENYQGISERIKQTFLKRGWEKLGENGIVTLDKVEEIVEMSI